MDPNIVFLLIVVFCVGLVRTATYVVRLNRRGPRISPRIEVGQSLQAGNIPVEHTISARIVEGRSVLHYTRIDMREENWEKQLAEATVDMKHKLRAIEAAKRIVDEANPM